MILLLPSRSLRATAQAEWDAAARITTSHTPTCTHVHTGDLTAAKPLIAGNLARKPNETLTRVSMKPKQLHFHARSEHLVGGEWALAWRHCLRTRHGQLPASLSASRPLHPCMRQQPAHTLWLTHTHTHTGLDTWREAWILPPGNALS